MKIGQLIKLSSPADIHTAARSIHATKDSAAQRQAVIPELPQQK
jgi:hypothetical protein